MRLKGVVAEDFINYKLPSLFLITSVCDWKCCTEQGLDISVCQNSPMVNRPTKEYEYDMLCKTFINNDITKAVVIGGLEPMLQFGEIYAFLSYLRQEYHCHDSVIIYTGYYPNEIEDKIRILQEFDNIIIKFGRFIPNRPSRYDDVLGITLASDNQYAEVIS